MSDVDDEVFDHVSISVVMPLRSHLFVVRLGRYGLADHSDGFGIGLAWRQLFWDIGGGLRRDPGG